MHFRESFKIAIDSILSNKMRSFLTMLGIIIGISSVITILALGEGGRNYITGTFENIGATTIEVSVSGDDLQNKDYFTLDDIEYLKERVAEIKYTTPIAGTRGEISTDLNKMTAVYQAGSEDLKNIVNAEFLEGRFFTKNEAGDGRGVVVIDENTALVLFGRRTNIVGESTNITLGNAVKRVRIIGVTKTLNPLAGAGDFGQNFPAFVYMPYNLYREMSTEPEKIDRFFVASESRETTDQVARNIVSLLKIRKNNMDREIYKASSFLQTLDQVDDIISLFTTFIGAVAAISLVVGGIGVMNIMLVSVTERTREIGIRKAIGATTTNILFQFLTESVILSLIGGFIGMTLGVILSTIGGGYVGITPIISVGQIIGVAIFSSAIGVFFGIYPARKAAKMDPIDALRYE